MVKQDLDELEALTDDDDFCFSRFCSEFRITKRNRISVDFLGKNTHWVLPTHFLLTVLSSLKLLVLLVGKNHLVLFSFFQKDLIFKLDNHRPFGK